MLVARAGMFPAEGCWTRNLARAPCTGHRNNRGRGAGEFPDGGGEWAREPGVSPMRFAGEAAVAVEVGCCYVAGPTTSRPAGASFPIFSQPLTQHVQPALRGVRR